MRLVIPANNPSIVRIIDFEDRLDSIKSSLTFRDKAANFEYQRFKKATWMMQKLGPEGFEEKLQELKAAITKTLLFTDETGLYTYAGLANKVSRLTGVSVESEVVFPQPKKVPWLNEPPFRPYEYQQLSHDRLMDIKHGGVEIGTGLGKSFIIQNLLRTFGLKTIVMTPATSISDQLYETYVKAFGKKLVGKFYDGKKESNKLFVIANAQSLTKVTKGTEHWDNLLKTQVFIADESHQCPASTLASVCFGVASRAPYRFFFSATQMRNDGRDLLLEGITGPIVYTKTVQEGVREGFLAKPIFRILRVPTDSTFESPDVNKLTRAHLYYNDAVVQKIAKIVNSAADQGLPAVVLIEEVEQFSRLLPYLRHKVGFAHGPLSDNKSKVPEPYWESDPTQLVKDFNSLNLPVLVGTSCISTGTDIKPVRLLVYWQGGKSEIQVKQAIGRATRKCDNKPFCTIIDVDVYNVDTLARHAEERRKIYRELFPDVKDIT